MSEPRKVDLDVLELKARAAEASGDMWCNSPPVTLALIARIRELETMLERCTDMFAFDADLTGTDPGFVAGLRTVLKKGVVLP